MDKFGKFNAEEERILAEQARSCLPAGHPARTRSETERERCIRLVRAELLESCGAARPPGDWGPALAARIEDRIRTDDSRGPFRAVNTNPLRIEDRIRISGGDGPYRERLVSEDYLRCTRDDGGGLLLPVAVAVDDVSRFEVRLGKKVLRSYFFEDVKFENSDDATSCVASFKLGPGSVDVDFGRLFDAEFGHLVAAGTRRTEADRVMTLWMLVSVSLGYRLGILSDAIRIRDSEYVVRIAGFVPGPGVCVSGVCVP